jgi:hypothetical protein
MTDSLSFAGYGSALREAMTESNRADPAVLLAVLLNPRFSWVIGLNAVVVALIVVTEAPLMRKVMVFAEPPDQST